MTGIKWFTLGAFLLLTAPLTFASNVYIGGFEDSINGDYDYNDLVFSLTGNNITLHTATGDWFPEPVLGTSGSPFWNHASGDGAKFNVGYCVYGTGNCDHGVGLDPTDLYLATSAGAAVGDVWFSVTGPVDSPVLLHIAGFRDLIGWYPIGQPNNITWINSATTQTGFFSFDPHGDFGLVGDNNGVHPSLGQLFYANTSDGGKQDSRGAHFAFFGDPSPVPEPGTMMLFGTALLGFSVFLRRHKSSGQ